ncbi:MAG: cytochrome c [Croceibacterium sp.]
MNVPTKALLCTLPLAIGTLALGAVPAHPQRSEQQVFRASCAYCHDAGGWGTRTLARRVPAGEAELLKRKNLPADYTRFVVRRGVGAMPPLTPTDVTDEELERMARWLDQKN